jgi:hypothetical protein
MQCCESVVDAYAPCHSWHNGVNLLSSLKYQGSKQIEIDPGTFDDSNRSYSDQEFILGGRLSIYERLVQEYTNR